MYLLQRDSQFLNGHDLFLKRVGASYHAFIEEAEKVCRGKCQEDLQSTTRYVTWSLHTKSRSSLKAMLSKVRLLPLEQTSQMLKSCITFACTANPKSTFGACCYAVHDLGSGFSTLYSCTHADTECTALLFAIY